MRVSVIIPALNEEQHVTDTLRSVVEAGPCEIILVDGGSNDQTRELAAAHAEVLDSEPGRAKQMNAGARRASGDTFLFLHADTLLPRDGFTAIGSALARSEVVGGCFRLRFASTSPVMKFFAAWTALPLKSLCFGDRALFARRDAFTKAGGFPDVPVFEDLEMVRALAGLGDFVRLPTRVTTSPRRFEQNGATRQQLLNSYLWVRYHLGTPPEHLAAFYSYPPTNS